MRRPLHEKVVCRFSLKAFAGIVPLPSEVRGIQLCTLNAFTDVEMRSTGGLYAENAHHLSDGQGLGNRSGKIRI
ncbi:MAG: hypothetical protein NWR45_09440 [Candidatus Nanopelagicales bacterium]|nr:hypothetical protein [Candidatus Nanopelagicales bacterium]